MVQRSAHSDSVSNNRVLPDRGAARMMTGRSNSLEKSGRTSVTGCSAAILEFVDDAHGFVHTGNQHPGHHDFLCDTLIAGELQGLADGQQVLHQFISLLLVMIPGGLSIA